MPVGGAGLAPSPWVVRWAREIAPGGHVLDLAAGSGRHALFLSEQGFHVDAVDRDISALAEKHSARLQISMADLENAEWPYPGRRFDGIVVTCYLHRTLFPVLIDALSPRGVLIYEAFMAGNERYGRPSNPDFLLQPNELLKACGAMKVLGFEQGYLDATRPAMMQRVCASM